MKKNFIMQLLALRRQDCHDPGYVIPHLFSQTKIPNGYRTTWAVVAPDYAFSKTA